MDPAGGRWAGGCCSPPRLAGSFGTNGTTPRTSPALLGHPPLQRRVMRVPAGIVAHPEVFLWPPSSAQHPQAPTPAPTHHVRGMPGELPGEQDQGERGCWGRVMA